jgi:uncharacterized membrane protein (UPF0127 family)
MLADDVRLADSMLTRLRGLLFSPPLRSGEGLLLKPCTGIHMLGMSFPIDALFLDKQWQAVGMVESICPGQISRLFPRAVCCLEVKAGSLAATGTKEGDQFVFETRPD